MKEAEKRKRFNQVYLDNKDMIFRLCRAFLGQSAEVEDLFQEIFLKVWNHLDAYRGEAKISTWIYRIGANTALLYRKRSHRRKKRERAVEDQMIQGITYDDNDLRAKKEHHRRFNELLGLIAELEEVDRIIISMFLEGFSYKEIAEVSGLTVNNVGVKLSRIKNRLKKKIKVS